MSRPTADTIALLLTGVVALAVGGTVIVLLWNELTVPGYDASDAADGIGKIVGVLIGLLGGYMVGRRVNGNSDH